MALLLFLCSYEEGFLVGRVKNAVKSWRGYLFRHFAFPDRGSCNRQVSITRYRDTYAIYFISLCGWYLVQGLRA